MKRREFIAAFGGAAAWPLAARAQQGGLPVVGFLDTSTAAATAPFLAAFHKGLSEAGFDNDEICPATKELIDHLVGAHQNRRGYCKAERRGGLAVHDHLKLGRGLAPALCR